MRRSRRLFCAHLGGLLFLPAVRPVQAAVTTASLWLTDLQKARRRSIAERRPLLLFVMTDGCPYCHKMMTTTYTDAGVAEEAAKRFVLTMMNGTDQAELVKRIGVRIYPTTFLIAPNTQLIDRIEGYVPPNELRRRLALASRHVMDRSVPSGR